MAAQYFPPEPTTVLPALKIFEDLKGAKVFVKTRASAAIKATVTVTNAAVTVAREVKGKPDEASAFPVASIATAGVCDDAGLLILAVRATSDNPMV